jgi:hypothetical protein
LKQRWTAFTGRSVGKSESGSCSAAKIISLGFANGIAACNHRNKQAANKGASRSAAGVWRCVWRNAMKLAVSAPVRRVRNNRCEMFPHLERLRRLNTWLTACGTVKTALAIRNSTSRRIIRRAARALR